MSRLITILIFLVFINVAVATPYYGNPPSPCMQYKPYASSYHPIIYMPQGALPTSGLLLGTVHHPTANNNLFINPNPLFEIDAVEGIPLVTHGISVSLDGDKVLARGVFYEVQPIVIRLKARVTIGNDQFYTCAAGEQTVTLIPTIPEVSFIPSQMPWVVLNKEMFPSNYAIFIAANDGRISGISVTPINTTSPHPLSYYGVSYNPTTLFGKLSGDLRLTGTVTQPTFVEQAYQVSVTNSEGEIAKATFDLVIQGAPVVADANLGSGSYARGQIITPVSLSSHFKNPLQSGPINYVLSDSTGDQGSAVTAKYGVLVQNGQLVGKVPADAPSGTVQIYVQGQNMIGISGKAYYQLSLR